MFAVLLALSQIVLFALFCLLYCRGEWIHKHRMAFLKKMHTYQIWNIKNRFREFNDSLKWKMKIDDVISDIDQVMKIKNWFNFNIDSFVINKEFYNEVNDFYANMTSEQKKVDEECSKIFANY